MVVLSEATSDSLRRFMVPEPTCSVASVNFLNPKFSWMSKHLPNSVDGFVVALVTKLTNVTETDNQKVEGSC